MVGKKQTGNPNDWWLKMVKTRLSQVDFPINRPRDQVLPLLDPCFNIATIQSLPDPLQIGELMLKIPQNRGLAAAEMLGRNSPRLKSQNWLVVLSSTGSSTFEPFKQHVLFPPIFGTVAWLTDIFSECRKPPTRESFWVFCTFGVPFAQTNNRPYQRRIWRQRLFFWMPFSESADWQTGFVSMMKNGRSTINRHYCIITIIIPSYH